MKQHITLSTILTKSNFYLPSLSQNTTPFIEMKPQKKTKPFRGNANDFVHTKPQQ